MPYAPKCASSQPAATVKPLFFMSFTTADCTAVRGLMKEPLLVAALPNAV